MPVKEYEPLYTVKEVAKVLKISVQDVYKLINNGHIPCLVIGSKKVRGKDLEAFINSPEHEVLI